MGLAVICQLSVSGAASAAVATTNTPTASSTSVAPNAVSEVDCNGASPKYGTVRHLAANCTDPLRFYDGKATRFYDNNRYIGHDEPSVKFISSTPGSGNTMTYVQQIPKDPGKPPSATGSVTNYGELSVAPWFGLPICDPKSYPQNACTPDSDTNSGLISDPNSAGSAFMELQFYRRGTPVHRLHQLQQDQVVRGADHRQPRVHVRLRDLQQQLHRAGQLRVPADQRRPGRAAEPAADRRQHLHPGPQHPDDQPRGIRSSSRSRTRRRGSPPWSRI
jgi:hypothetical protein